MKGVILTNAYSSFPEADYQPFRLKEEFSKLGVTVDILKNDFFHVIVQNNYIQNKLEGYDFCIYLDKDKYVLHALQKSKMRVFNNYNAIETCDDKMTTYLALAGHGIPLVKTLPGLLCYDKSLSLKQSALDEVEKVLGYPVIVKESYGSLGKGVYLAKDREELNEIAEKLKCVPHLFQQFISESAGRDVRVIVVGDRVLGGMLRQGKDDFRSNIGAGGSGSVYTLDQNTSDLALKIARVLDLKYCGIDFLLTSDGPLVCEVNSNAFFSSFERVTGVNVAKAYAQFILKNI